MARQTKICEICKDDDEIEVPLLWTFRFPGAEYWCPHCGYVSGMLGAGTDVPTTPTLLAVEAAWKERSAPFLNGDTDDWSYHQDPPDVSVSPDAALLSEILTELHAYCDDEEFIARVQSLADRLAVGLIMPMEPGKDLIDGAMQASVEAEGVYDRDRPQAVWDRFGKRRDRIAHVYRALVLTAMEAATK